MKRIGDAVSELIAGNPILSFGFHHRLLNLSQVARFILPMVEALTHKEVRESAIQMSLSRLQAKIVPARLFQPLRLDRINVHGGMSCYCFAWTKSVHQGVNRLFSYVQERGGYININEGIKEVSVVLDDENTHVIKKLIGEEPSYFLQNIAAVGVRFCDDVLVLDTPGILYQLLESLAFQNISIVEVSSTTGEFLIFVRERDSRLALDTIYNQFTKGAQEAEHESTPLRRTFLSGL